MLFVGQLRVCGWLVQAAEAGKGFQQSDREGELQRSASHSFSAAPREVCMQGCDVVVICSILGGASAGQLELLGSMGELERGVWVGRVRQQGALPFQHICHPFKQVQETKG